MTFKKQRRRFRKSKRQSYAPASYRQAWGQYVEGWN